MADAFWELKFKGERVGITIDDLTRHRMREIGDALGDDYRIPSQFVAKLLMGDMDAIAGAVWIDGQVNGRPIGDMLALDFSQADLLPLDKPKAASRKKKADPQLADTSARTRSSETPTNSDSDS